MDWIGEERERERELLGNEQVPYNACKKVPVKEANTKGGMSKNRMESRFHIFPSAVSLGLLLPSSV